MKRCIVYHDRLRFPVSDTPSGVGGAHADAQDRRLPDLVYSIQQIAQMIGIVGAELRIHPVEVEALQATVERRP